MAFCFLNTQLIYKCVTTTTNAVNIRHVAILKYIIYVVIQLTLFS